MRNGGAALCPAAALLRHAIGLAQVLQAFRKQHGSTGPWPGSQLTNMQHAATYLADASCVAILLQWLPCTGWQYSVPLQEAEVQQPDRSWLLVTALQLKQGGPCMRIPLPYLLLQCKAAFDMCYLAAGQRAAAGDKALPQSQCCPPLTQVKVPQPAAGSPGAACAAGSPGVAASCRQSGCRMCCRQSECLSQLQSALCFCTGSCACRTLRGLQLVRLQHRLLAWTAAGQGAAGEGGPAQRAERADRHGR